MPSLVTRSAFLAALALPFFLKISIACSMPPLASFKAWLHSPTPAPVRSRNWEIVFRSVIFLLDYFFFYFCFFLFFSRRLLLLPFQRRFGHQLSDKFNGFGGIVIGRNHISDAGRVNI